ncbi:hypothetical protein [Arenimonas sp.]|uniref:hypothetical protein n=1 Tax=Arenimonas sp. TaxID=1872635 RepID=UPI0039E2EB37
MNATTSAVPGTADYRNFHLWMLFPFAVSILGFSYSYYLNFTGSTFHQHVHGISATLWYLLVVVQPYLITRRKDIRRHRLFGAIGTLLAGVVAGSALTIIPKNIDDVAKLDPNGFFNPTFAYFAVIIDVVLVGLFLVSVFMAIYEMKRRNLAGHVQWMMASVLAVLSPGLARLFGILFIVANQGNLDGISLVKLAVPSMIAMMLIIVVYFRKFGSFRHPAFWLLMAAHAPYLFVVQIGDNQAIRSVLAAIFK